MADCSNEEYLERRLYPVLRAALGDMLDLLRDSSKVQRYLEKAAAQRLIEEEEIVKTEKQKLRDQLGSAYVSSGSELGDEDGKTSFEIREADDGFFSERGMRGNYEESRAAGKRKKEQAKDNPLVIFLDLIEKRHHAQGH